MRVSVFAFTQCILIVVVVVDIARRERESSSVALSAASLARERSREAYLATSSSSTDAWDGRSVGRSVARPMHIGRVFDENARIRLDFIAFADAFERVFCRPRARATSGDDDVIDRRDRARKADATNVWTSRTSPEDAVSERLETPRM